MNTAHFRTVANSLIVGAVLGFIGGAWAVQATHSSKAALADNSREDMTSNAILSSLTRIHDQCAVLQHEVTPTATASKPAALHRTGTLTSMNP